MDEQPPALPTQVSSDGREVWDWAANLSNHLHRECRKQELRAELRVIGTVCGDCDNWMKSRLCPRERNINGRNHGPSMNELVSGCKSFIESLAETERRDKLQQQLAELSKTPPADGERR